MHVTSIEAVGNIRFISFLRKLKCLYVFFNQTGLHESSYYFHSKVPFLFNKRGLIVTAFLIALIVLRYSRGVLGDDSRNSDHDIDIH